MRIVDSTLAKKEPAALQNPPAPWHSGGTDRAVTVALARASCPQKMGFHLILLRNIQSEIALDRLAERRSNWHGE